MNRGIESFKKLDKANRKKMIIGVYLRSPRPLSDREVCYQLGFVEPNAVRPRITEILKEENSPLMICKRVKDTVTGRQVRTVIHKKSFPQDLLKQSAA